MFRKKNYCEVCLKNCIKNDTIIKYVKQEENNDVALVRFGHKKCLDEYFSEYTSSTQGGSLVHNIKSFDFEKINLEIDNLTGEIKELNDESNKAKYILVKSKIKKIQSIYSK
jgi:hypothetical protein